MLPFHFNSHAWRLPSLNIFTKAIALKWHTYGYCMCYGMIRAWDVRIHLQSFIHDHGRKQALVNKQQTDMNEARQRVFLKQVWVIKSWGVIRKHKQKSRLGQTVSKTGSDNSIIQNTQARIKGPEDRQGKTELRLGLGN